MGLPSKKRTPRSKKDRASHFALKKVGSTTCADCGTATLPHRACVKCGTYRTRKTVNVEKRATRLTRSHKATGKTKK